MANSHSNPYPHSPRKSNSFPIWVWFLIGFIVLVGLICTGGLGALVYVGANTPDTAVYVGNRVPQQYVEAAKEVGGLEDDERIRFFYSDGFLNVKDGFYYVSDRKVVIYYSADDREEPLIEIPFEEIEAVDLNGEESFLLDSEILIELKNGDVVSFPVSSEHGRDVDFFNEIKKQIK